MQRLKCFRWIGLAEQSQHARGVVLAINSQHAIQQLAQQGITPYHLRTCHRWHKLNWSHTQCCLFFTQLGQLLANGLTLNESLALLKTTQSLFYWAILCEHIQQGINQGNSLSSTLLQWPQIFSSICSPIIHIGETTGQLDLSCQQLASLLHHQTQLMDKVSHAFRYPIFLLVTTLALMGFMLYFVLPEFAILYQSINAPLPAFTYGLMQLANKLFTWLPGLLLTSILVFFVGFQLNRRSHRWQFFWQCYRLKIPKIGELSQAAHLALLFTTLQITHHAGLTLLNSLGLVQAIFTQYFWQQSICEINQHLQQGKSLAASLQLRKEYPPFCIGLLKAGERTGQLEYQFQQLAEWYQQRAMLLSEQLTALIRPVMMLICGALIGSLVIALYLPVLNLGSSLG